MQPVPGENDDTEDINHKDSDQEDQDNYGDTTSKVSCPYIGLVARLSICCSFKTI